MNSIPILSSILGLSFASGINLYAAVLVVGLGERFGWISGLPGSLDTLAHPAILSIAGIMYLLEFFADKIPFVSVAWDSIHTVIRPLGAAALALASTSKLSPELQAIAMLAGGSVALGSHSTKMGYRLIAHASPEPVSNSIFSVAEDFGVVGLVLLTYQHPMIAAGIVAALLIGIAIAMPFLLRVLTFLASGLAGRISSWFSSSDACAIPAWLAPELDRLGSGRSVYRCFARKVPKAARMRQGYLIVAEKQWYFAFRGWVRPRLIPISSPAPTVDRGLLFDTLGADDWSVYFTKDCSPGNQPLASGRGSVPVTAR